MAQTTKEHLDADELLHLALTASQSGNSEEAMTLLKRALALTPDDARVHYLLGAEHAQIGLYDRAAEEMQRAVKLNPSLETAHFQLGLLHLTSGRAEAAVEAWKPLDKLDHNHCLYLFKTGLSHLTKDEFTECEQYLRRGIEANKTNLVLNKDMLGILKEVEAHITVATGVSSAASVSQAPVVASREKKHVLLSAYKQNRTEDKDS